MIGNHIEEFRNLKSVLRYSGKKKLDRANVMEHTAGVGYVSFLLAQWEKYKFKNEVDFEKMTLIAYTHDLSEVYLGDMPSSAKDANPHLAKILKETEVKVIKGIAKGLPKTYSAKYLEASKDYSSKLSLESRLVKAADIIDTLMECLDEIEISNSKRYKNILKESLSKLFSLAEEWELKSLIYFLIYPAKDLGLTTYFDEYMEKKVSYWEELYEPYAR